MIKRLVDLPEEFESPPDEVLQQLREIDQDAECVGVSPGWWWAGRVKPLAERVQSGRRELARLQKDGADKKDPVMWPKIRNAILACQGFGPVCRHRFPLGEVHWSLLVEDFRYRCWWYLQYEDGDEEVRRAIEGTLDEDITARARAAVTERYFADPAYLFKRVIQQNPAGVPVGADLQ
jgi:hypothetical protein